MSTSARKISETFNGRREWQIGGASFFKLLGTINPVDVELYLEGRQRLVAAQVEGGFYQRIDFDRVVITTGGAEAVDWLFGPAEGGSDRFTGAVTVAGTVDVSDRVGRALGQASLDLATMDRVLFGDDSGGGGFIGYGSLGAVAANVHEMQIWNPVGSGKTVYVDKITPQPGAATLFTVRVHNAALTTLGTTYPKNRGGAASGAEFRTRTGGAPIGTQVMALANQNFGQVEFKPPFRLPEGQGVHLATATVNIALDCSIEFRER